MMALKGDLLKGYLSGHWTGEARAHGLHGARDPGGRCHQRVARAPGHRHEQAREGRASEVPSPRVGFGRAKLPRDVLPAI